jgi:hypothetical protein
MELKIKIINQFYFARRRWITPDLTAQQIIREAETILETQAPRSAFKNLSIKFRTTVESVWFAIDTARRYIVAALYLAIAIPSVTIMHAGEKLMLGISFIIGSIADAFKNLLSRFTRTRTTSNVTNFRSSNTKINGLAPDVVTIELGPRPNVLPVTETQLAIYRPALSFSTTSETVPANNNQKIFDRLLQKIEEYECSKLFNRLKREHALSSATPSNIRIRMDVPETGDRALDYINNNENKIILAGLNLLEDEKFLDPKSYKNLFKSLELTTFLTSDQAMFGQETRLDYLAAILCISWALSAIMKNRGYDVIRGSYTIVNNNLIYKFYLGYVQLVTGSDDPGYLVNTSSFGYRRDPGNKLTSHYTDQTNQYGIDMRFEAAGEAFGILPHGHEHILFGLINSSTTVKSTFFKFEPHGLGTVSDLAKHALDFANANKVYGVTYREKDVPGEFREIYSMFCRQTGETARAKLVKDMWEHIEEFLDRNSPSPSLHTEATPVGLLGNHQKLFLGNTAREQFKQFSFIKYKNHDIKHRYGNEILMQYPDESSLTETAKRYGCDLQ